MRGRRALRPREGAGRHRPLPHASRATSFGREDLAFVSYHMGIGNLEGVLDAYGERPADLRRSSTSTPRRRRHRARLPAARRASATTRPTTGGSCSRRGRSCACTATTAAQLGRLAVAAHREGVRRGGAAPGRPDRRRSRRPTTCSRRGTTARSSRSRSDEAVTGLRRDRRMGELARRMHQPAERYRGLRPEALAMALYIGAQVREISGQSPLIVTSTVRDGAYQRAARRPQRRGDAQLLAAHHRLGVRRRCATTARAGRRWPSSSCSTGCAR